MDNDNLFHACVTQLTALGIPTEQYLNGEYFGINAQKLANGLWEIWVILDWDQCLAHWNCGVKCIVSENLQIKQYTLLTQRQKGRIIEHFQYP
ncbi:MAG: hypothetical protein RMX68_000095 [Aulosira sp. ZfuVER01]|nr:hypothetical protein [Aulosira sp. ZfuVER01]MDZ8001946.1 hypothetical protein [Aulosira sp. DedVER01a]MDZ8055274.1 hypothetical protein [Aulosira sp. ZfuCHP01]